jgi:uncharacterized protein YraI
MRENSLSLTILWLFLFMTAQVLAANQILDKYKSLMSETSSASVSLPARHLSENTDTNKSTVSKGAYKSHAEEIKEIVDLKQGTFESSGEFQKRRDDKIADLDKKVVFLAQDGDKEYSAGTATMKHYDADSEIMTLTLHWNADLEPLLPETKAIKTATMKISRANAKKLFEKKDTHYFHINITYQDSRPTLSRMAMYGKYKLEAVKTKTLMPKPIKSAAVPKHSPSSFTPIHIDKSNIKSAAKVQKPYAPPPSSLPASDYKKYRVVRVASYDTLNVRTDPFVSRNNKIGEIPPNGRNINKLFCRRNYKGVRWCKIEYQDYGYPLKGWVVERCLAPQGSHSSYGGGDYYRVVNIRSDDTLTVRSGPGTEYYHIGDLPYNARGVSVGRCRYSSKGGKWCFVRYGGIEGWSSAKYLRRQ